MGPMLAHLARRVEVLPGYHRRRMLRISWPLAFLLAASIAIVARRPRMLPWMLVAFAVWYVVESARRSRRP